MPTYNIIEKRAKDYYTTSYVAIFKSPKTSRSATAPREGGSSESKEHLPLHPGVKEGSFAHLDPPLDLLVFINIFYIGHAIKNHNLWI